MTDYAPTPTSASDSRWGGPCWKCGHPASYHGMTFCNAPANRLKCDCDGYAPVSPALAPPSCNHLRRFITSLDKALDNDHCEVVMLHVEALRDGYAQELAVAPSAETDGSL